jgi:hypothetical protein
MLSINEVKHCLVIIVFENIFCPWECHTGDEEDDNITDDQVD